MAAIAEHPRRLSHQYTCSQRNLAAPIPLPSKSTSDPPSQLKGIRNPPNLSISSPSPSSDTMALDPQPRCLFFDVFGTCVDWRTTVTNTLYNASSAALNSATSSIATRIRMTASNMTFEDWGQVAQEWRDTYITFVSALAADASIPYKTVDAHHLDSLREILTARGLLMERAEEEMPDDAMLAHDGSLWDEATIQRLALIWHLLDPWPDTVAGLSELNRLFWTCTLSNGNLSLLEDMKNHANMPFTHLFSAEMFSSYKPNPKVYLGAVEKMGCKPEECVMVAAHLGDLRAAKKVGMRTAHVERPLEEREKIGREEASEFVDVWVGEGEGGFLGLAERLGVQVERTRKRSGSAPPEVGKVEV